MKRMTRWQWKWHYWKATRFEDAEEVLFAVLVWLVIAIGFAMVGAFMDVR